MYLDSKTHVAYALLRIWAGRTLKDLLASVTNRKALCCEDLRASAILQWARKRKAWSQKGLPCKMQNAAARRHLSGSLVTSCVPILGAAAQQPTGAFHTRGKREGPRAPQINLTCYALWAEHLSFINQPLRLTLAVALFAEDPWTETFLMRPRRATHANTSFALCSSWGRIVIISSCIQFLSLNNSILQKDVNGFFVPLGLLIFKVQKNILSKFSADLTQKAQRCKRPCKWGIEDILIFCFQCCEVAISELERP